MALDIVMTLGDVGALIDAGYDELRVYRRAAEADPWVEVTGVGTRPTLVSGVSAYTFSDPTGAYDLLYEAAPYDVDASTEGTRFSPAVGGLYLTIADLRAEGVPTSVTDAALVGRIETYQRVVESVTRQWFVGRNMTWDFAGNGTTLAQFPVPIVSASALYLNEDFTNAADVADYQVHDGKGGSTGRDDRKNPRVRIVTTETSIFAGTGRLTDRRLVFEVGELNCRLVGTFGYVEPDGSVPAPIVHATKRLVVRGARPLWSQGAAAAGPVIEEETDRHRLKYADPSAADKQFSITGTGDRETDMILAGFRAPFSVRAPRTTFRRFKGRTVV